MDQTTPNQQMHKLSVVIDRYCEEMNQEYERFQVALTGVLRLLSGQVTTLSNLRGSPDDLRGYIIQLAADLHQKTLAQYNALRTELNTILETAESN
ncbi:MAG: hypothetical protein ACXADL_03855 [Candidatus Thorarchaeota archaeon]|jgi:hypothetical protein